MLSTVRLGIILSVLIIAVSPPMVKVLLLLLLSTLSAEVPRYNVTSR
jgi:hypothetical protein